MTPEPINPAPERWAWGAGAFYDLVPFDDYSGQSSDIGLPSPSAPPQRALMPLLGNFKDAPEGGWTHVETLDVLGTRNYLFAVFDNGRLYLKATTIKPESLAPSAYWGEPEEVEQDTPIISQSDDLLAITSYSIDLGLQLAYHGTRDRLLKEGDKWLVDAPWDILAIIPSGGIAVTLWAVQLDGYLAIVASYGSEFSDQSRWTWATQSLPVQACPPPWGDAEPARRTSTELPYDPLETSPRYIAHQFGIPRLITDEVISDTQALAAIHQSVPVLPPSTECVFYLNGSNQRVCVQIINGLFNRTNVNLLQTNTAIYGK